MVDPTVAFELDHPAASRVNSITVRMGRRQEATGVGTGLLRERASGILLGPPIDGAQGEGDGTAHGRCTRPV